MAFIEQFTPTQQRLLAILADGKPHEKSELLTALNDEMADAETLIVHFVNIRKILRPIGEDIVCVVLNRKHCYRHIKLLPEVRFVGGTWV